MQQLSQSLSSSPLVHHCFYSISPSQIINWLPISSLFLNKKTWFEPPVFPTNYLVLPCFAIKTWYVTLCNYKTWNGKISLEPPQSPKNRLNPSHTSTPAGRPRQPPRQTFQRSRQAGVLLDLERSVKSIGLVKGINGKSTVATPTLDYLRWSPRNSR